MTDSILFAAPPTAPSLCLAGIHELYEADPAVVWAALAGFAVLIAMVIAMAFCRQRRRKAEKALRESEWLYRVVTENVRDEISLHDAEGRHLFVSRSCHPLTGYEPEELAGVKDLDLFHPDDFERCRAAMEEVKAGRDPGEVEYRFRHKDGHYVWLASTARALPRQEGEEEGRFLLVTRDISARKRAEEELVHQKCFADALFEALPGIVIVEDRNRRILRCNRNAEELLGIPAGEIIGRHGWEFVREEDREKDMRAFDVGMAGGRAPVEVHVIDRHGREVPFHCDGVRMGTGDDARLIVVGLDISDRKRATDALRESEVRYRTLFEFAGDGIFLMEGNRFVDCNERGREMFGCPRDQIIGAGPEKFSPPRQPDGRDTKEKADELIAAALTGGPQRLEWQHQRADGTLFDAEVALTRVELGEKRMLLAAVRDVTERNRSQRAQAALREELHQSQKMEAVGQVAGGAAHDFNNLLTVILGNAELARLTLPEDSSARGLLDQITQAAKQASALTRSLLTFSRRLPAAKTRIDLRTSVRETADMLRRVLPASIELEVEGDTGEPLHVQADPTRIQQVLMNLALNARDAMPDGGTLRIAAAAEPSADAPERAVLSVTDTGVGMTPEVLRRIFEPFFTTKPRGQGTGLGLSIVHGIVADHGGRIEAVSTPGEGSIFTVALPIARAAAGGEQPNPLAEAPLGAGQKLLLAEDDPLVAQTVTAMLRSLRYDVEKVPDGEALLDRVRAEPKRFRLLIVDVDLPKRGGLDALRQLRTDGVPTPAIVITGTIAPELGPELANTDLLTKPFEARDLAETVARMLEAGQETD